MNHGPATLQLPRGYMPTKLNQHNSSKHGKPRLVCQSPQNSFRVFRANLPTQPSKLPCRGEAKGLLSFGGIIDLVSTGG